jgi:hypothetical protein
MIQLLAVPDAAPEAEDTGPDWDALTFVRLCALDVLPRGLADASMPASPSLRCSQAAPDALYFSWCNKDPTDAFEQICDNECLSELWMSQV